MSLLMALAPALQAQVVHRADPRLVDPAALWTTTRAFPVTTHTVDLSRALFVSSAPRRDRLVLDSLGTRQAHGHALAGALIGLAAGAGTGYLVSLERVAAIERGQHDGPFQQIDYVLDPVIGGVLGAIIGGVIGSHVR